MSRAISPSFSTVGVKSRLTPIFLVADADLAVFFGDRDRELAAGEETRRLARAGDQVRLGQPAGDAALFQRLDGDVDRDAVRQQPTDDSPVRASGIVARIELNSRPPMP